MSKTTLQWTLFSGSNNSLVCESLHKSVASVVLFIHTVWNVNSAPGSQPLKMQAWNMQQWVHFSAYIIE